ncbi:hypothetical protein [Embleya sp. NBC_00896]|uniref:hypothetical protein n=1 Tax=Embleya sp. NBC_00896 TaxID=2975961 RepID=UPI00386522B8|nr:hypothetical protein OG928_48025 [Embleya sp. NBC_00896]
MQQLARSRSQNGPARVYVSVAPRITERPSWPKRLEDIRAELPENIELVTYHDAFDDHSAYTEGWPDLAASLDGLIVVAVRKKTTGLVYVVGPAARRELRTMAGARKPVLLHAIDHGLVPLVDLEPRRIGSDGRQQLKLAVPPRWNRSEPTLRAALGALGAGPAVSQVVPVG